MTAETAGTREQPDESTDRIDPERSVCVLIGVDRYEELPALRSVRENLEELRAVLTDRSIWGIPKDRIVTVPSPTDASRLVDPIWEAALRAEDTLIVYYAGHGLLNEARDELWLTMPGSVEDRPETCVRAEDVQRAIRKPGSARRRVLILDCCFSGQVMPQMSADDQGATGGSVAVTTLEEVEGSYVMTSAPRNRAAHAPDPARCTRFTQALVDVMREGVPQGPEMLGLHELFKAVRKRVVKDPGDPEPQDTDQNGVGGLAFVRNLAVVPRLPEPVPVQRGPARATRWALLAGAGGLALGLSVVPAVGWWQRTFPEPAGGECAPGAVLLDHSDMLNKQHVHNEAVEDLSALALTSESPARALAVTDNKPARLFPLELGTPFGLEPSVETARTLRKADGTGLDDWYDGEALVVEKGGRTALVGSETGPSIRRFDLGTGRQIGEPVPVPEELRSWPDGGGEMGRTIESLTVSPDGRYLYAGWEAPIAPDGDSRGSGILRIQRYKGSPGGSYVPDEQYAYLAGTGLYLTELVALGEGRLLALERQYVDGMGNAVRIVELSLGDAQDVTGKKSLHQLPADLRAESRELFDLADCPAGGPGVVATAPGATQANPLLGNVEGMALGTAWSHGRYKGWRPLYLVTDDNGQSSQLTRVYSVALRL